MELKLISVSKLAKAADIDKYRLQYSVRDKEEPSNLTSTERKKVIEELEKAHKENVKYFDF